MKVNIGLNKWQDIEGQKQLKLPCIQLIPILNRFMLKHSVNISTVL